jgi:hypothetical protein
VQQEILPADEKKESASKTSTHQKDDGSSTSKERSSSPLSTRGDSMTPLSTRGDSMTEGNGISTISGRDIHGQTPAPNMCKDDGKSQVGGGRDVEMEIPSTADGRPSSELADLPVDDTNSMPIEKASLTR